MVVEEISNCFIDTLRVCHWPHVSETFELHNPNPWQDRGQKSRHTQRRLGGRFSYHI